MTTEGEPSRRKRPKPVKGQQIHISLRVAILCILGLVVFGLGMGTIFVLFLQDAYAHFFENGPPLEDPLVRLLSGAGIVGAPLLSVRQIRKVRRDRRIIIGADRLQIVEGRGEDITVLMSLPYDNIEKLKCTEVGFWHQLDFDVRDTHDPDTYFAGTDLEENFRTLGHHYEIAEGYEEPMEEIETLIRRAWKKHGLKHGMENEVVEVEEALPGNTQRETQRETQRKANPAGAPLIRDESDKEYRPKSHRGRVPEPVEGEVIRTTHSAARFAMQCCVFGVVVGVVLLCVWCVEMFGWAFEGRVFPAPDPILWGLGLIGVLIPLRFVLLRRTRTGWRIVIGYDCVQVLEGQADDTRVVASLPFENIEATKTTRIDFGFRLDFELTDIRDPGTYLPGVDIEANYRMYEYHYAITGTYEEPMSEIEFLIRRALKQWRKKHQREDE